MNNDSFAKEVLDKENRKINAQQKKTKSVWSGLGMFGMVGWSVSVPTLLGAAFGHWLDQRFPQPFSWTLTGLLLGLCMGSFLAWYWIGKEDKEMHQTKDNKDE